jgi:two-component system sensor histidine kinase KdpD
MCGDVVAPSVKILCGLREAPVREAQQLHHHPLDAGSMQAHICAMDMRTHATPTEGRVTVAAAMMVLRYIAALAMVAVSTIAGHFLAPRWGNSAVDLLYLPTILASAILFGLWPALAAGLASALAYNFFFTPPFHTFRMDRPADIVTVVILFLVAAVTSKLAANVREQAALATVHANRNATVAGFATRLLICPDKQGIASVGCGELARIFACNAVMVEGLPIPAVIAAAPTPVAMTPSEIATAAAVLESGESAGRGAKHPYPTDWQFHPVGPGGHVVAAAGLVRDDEALAVRDDQHELLESLLSQLALALERARLEGEARDLSALRERDKVRSGLLSSIGRDLKPRVDFLAKAARELRRSAPEAKASVSAVASEVARMERYLSNLLELEPESDQRPLEVNGVTIDMVHRRVSKHGKDVHLTPKEYAVFAELAKHPGRVLSHAHLLRTAWGPAQEGQTEYLRVAIRSLRQKLERSPARPELIINEPAVGYRLMG